MTAVRAHALGATLAVRAQPGAKKDAVLGTHADAIKVAVTAPPLDGRANAAVVEVLAEWLGVKRSQLEIIGGEANRNKVVLVRGVVPDALVALVATKLGSA